MVSAGFLSKPEPLCGRSTDYLRELPLAFLSFPRSWLEGSALLFLPDPKSKSTYLFPTAVFRLVGVLSLIPLPLLVYLPVAVVLPATGRNLPVGLPGFLGLSRPLFE